MVLYCLDKEMWHMDLLGENICITTIYLKGLSTEYLNASESETHSTVWIIGLIVLFAFAKLIMKGIKHYPGIPSGSKLIANSCVNNFPFFHTHITNALH